jgi:hypothetical protein
MRKGQLKVLGILSGVVLAAGALITACSDWQGVEIERQDLVSPNGAITQGADEARSNWYPDQPGLDPAIVGGPNFKRIFTTNLASATEQVLAQPLVFNGKVLIASESNNLYLLDEVTGTITAQRSLGTPYTPNNIDNTGMNCGDLPTVGITGTPVIDTSTSTAYVVSKASTGVHTMHAIDLNSSTLVDKTGFPVTITGTAQNDTTKTFNSNAAHQRPGLLLMGGVVYAGFASHCDMADYRGWVIGVSTAGAIKARYTTQAGSTGHASGIWMSGAGLMSDGAGKIVFATGNGIGNNALPGPIASTAPPAYQEESVVRTTVQADGSLKATDWFEPAIGHNMGDDDLAAGGITALPSQFSTTAFPRVAVIVGKHGILHVLNRDKLGGYQNGAGAGDDIFQSLPMSGFTWGHPSVWPGDGGYVFVTANGGTNGGGFRLQVLKWAPSGTTPGFSLVGVGQSFDSVNKVWVMDDFGAYSGSPVVTSNNTNAGSALVWVVSNTGQLRVYSLAAPNLHRIYADTTGGVAKFQTVGVGSGRIYVGTSKGTVLGYGAGPSPLTGPALNFGNVTVGSGSPPLNATITANQTLTIQAASSITSTNPVFTFDTSGLTFPKNMNAGTSFTLPVTFKPTAAGSASGAINIAIVGGGIGTIPLTGVGVVNAAQLNVTPVMLAFGGVVTGQTKALTLAIQNTGTQTLTFNAPTLPAAPYSATGVPTAGTTLAAGAQTTATVTFAPTAGGTFMANLVINSNGGNATIPLAGTSGTAAHMVVTPQSLDFGTITAGSSKTMNFTVQNTGGLDMAITISKYPTDPFVNTTTLGEGDVVKAGQTVTETVKFSSTTAGSYTGAWELTANDGGPRVTVALTGTVTGSVTSLPRTGWTASASNTGGTDVPANALDGDQATRWSTGTPMVANMYYQVDMGAANTVSQIQMDSANGDYARAYSVYVTNDPANLGTAVAAGTATATPVVVSFAAKSGRYIRVVLGTMATQTAWWSIQEFNAFGTSGGGGGGAIQINAGGPAASPYLADVDFTGGTTINHANTIDVSGVTNPAPAAVYQTGRVGSFSYTIPGFTAGSSHTVRLHMCETYFTTNGSRVFNVTLNGTQVLTAFDIRAAAGATNKAVVQQFTAAANASGQYVLQFTPTKDNALISGIEIQ